MADKGLNSDALCSVCVCTLFLVRPGGGGWNACGGFVMSHTLDKIVKSLSCMCTYFGTMCMYVIVWEIGRQAGR